MQKLACEAISQGKMSISIPWRCNVFSRNRTGLGRSLGHVGSSQISLFMMLHGSVVHKLPFAAVFCWGCLDFDGFAKRLLMSVVTVVNLMALWS